VFSIVVSLYLLALLLLPWSRAKIRSGMFKYAAQHLDHCLQLEAFQRLAPELLEPYAADVTLES
jgi:hypothetical protein